MGLGVVEAADKFEGENEEAEERETKVKSINRQCSNSERKGLVREDR